MRKRESIYFVDYFTFACSVDRCKVKTKELETLGRYVRNRYRRNGNCKSASLECGTAIASFSSSVPALSGNELKSGVIVPILYLEYPWNEHFS